MSSVGLEVKQTPKTHRGNAFVYDGTAVESPYAWDRDNRLRSVTPPTGTSTTYSYDANGLRTQRIDATGTTRYLLDGASVLGELDGANATTTSYLNNPQQIDDVLAYQRSTETEYPLTDALGSVYAATDASGSVAHRYDFDVYGTRSDLGGTALPIDRGYTSREHDANGLNYNRDRYLRPQVGRWGQPDRLGMVDGPNRYSYVGALPTMWTDPHGRFSVAPLIVPVAFVSRTPVLDSVTAFAITNPVGFLMLMAALGGVSESLVSAVVGQDCDQGRETLETFFRGDSLPRAQSSVTDGFAAAGVGTEVGQLGMGLYMSRDPQVAVGYASIAFSHFGSGAILEIAIPTKIWKVVMAMGAKDNAPLYVNAVQSFVPAGSALRLFDASTVRVIINSRTR